MRACRLKGANCASRADLVQTHITARILACTGAAASSSSSSTRHGRRPIERRQSRANACLQPLMFDGGDRGRGEQPPPPLPPARQLLAAAFVRASRIRWCGRVCRALRMCLRGTRFFVSHLCQPPVSLAGCHEAPPQTRSPTPDGRGKVGENKFHGRTSPGGG